MKASWPNSSAFASLPFASGFTLLYRNVTGGSLAEAWVNAMGYLGMAFSVYPIAGGFIGYRMGTNSPIDVTVEPMPDFVTSSIDLIPTDTAGVWTCIVKGYPSPADTFTHPQDWPSEPK